VKYFFRNVKHCWRNVKFAFRASYGVPDGTIQIEKIKAAKAAFIFYHSIFAENTSRAKPASRAARRASRICTANLLHCPSGIYCHFVTNKTFLTPKIPRTARTFQSPKHFSLHPDFIVL
jgi:hypothetical protein